MKSKVLHSLKRLQGTLTNESWSTYRRIVSKVCQDHSSFEWMSKVAGLIRNQDILALMEMSDFLSGQKYPTAAEHFAANQIVSLIKKYPFPSKLNPFDPEKKARETFAESEQRCKETNERFLGPVDWAKSPYRNEWNSMRSFINYVMGHTPPLGDIYDKCYFGPGASVGVHGNATNLARKFASDWSVTPGAQLYARSACFRNWHVFESLTRPRPGAAACLDPELAKASFGKRVTTVAYNKIAFVPKTVKTFRSIAVEPLLNGYVQSGVDVLLRARLLRVGINLTDQSINSRLARRGSTVDDDSSFVTIDLSSASDSIAINLCRDLLPSDWYAFLDAIRSPSYLIDGVAKRYHKFCSMGNGFCFPLETLLFTAACVASGAGEVGVDFHVYGDDIIVRKHCAKRVLGLLSEMGFVVNKEKTFLEGPFRESCGTDWYSGDDVRPFVLDFELNSFQSVAKFLNLSRRNARTTAFFDGVRDLLLGLLPEDLRIFRPLEGPPDTAVTVERDLFMTSPYAVWSRDLQCWSWRELISTPHSDIGWNMLRDSDLSLTMAALRGSRSDAPFTIRRKTRTTLRKVAYG